MDMPDLPNFDVPVYRHDRMPNGLVYKWIADNIRMLKKTGQMERIYRQESRQPVNVPFVLYK